MSAPPTPQLPAKRVARSRGAKRKWEHGSDFHWLDLDAPSERAPAPWDVGATWLSSGRDALRSVIQHGVSNAGWRRMWLPTYLCQKVTASIASTGIALAAYHDNPLRPTPLTPPVMRPGDVFFVVNYFGLRSTPRGARSHQFPIIEDHTHDPWSPWAFASTADFCIASLRKTMPLPDGAVVWSPLGQPLPAPSAVTPWRQAASAQRLGAMLLKAMYLEHRGVKKATFRELARLGESNIASGDVSGMSPLAAALLPNFPVRSWRDRRRANYERLRTELMSVAWATVLSPEDESASCPFAAVLLCDSASRCDRLGRALITHDVYPAALWPLDTAVLPTIPDSDRLLASQLICIHCDMRYTADDMDRVAELILRSRS